MSGKAGSEHNDRQVRVRAEIRVGIPPRGRLRPRFRRTPEPAWSSITMEKFAKSTTICATGKSFGNPSRVMVVTLTCAIAARNYASAGMLASLVPMMPLPRLDDDLHEFLHFRRPPRVSRRSLQAELKTCCMKATESRPGFRPKRWMIAVTADRNRSWALLGEVPSSVTRSGFRRGGS